MIGLHPLVLALFVIAIVLAAIVLPDDGMAACQLSHSFDVCHGSLH
jgi:hypothetical protein